MSSTFFTFYFIFKSTSLKRRFPRFDVVVVSSLLLHSYSMYVVAVKMQSRAKIFEVNELWCRRPPPRRGGGRWGNPRGRGSGAQTTTTTCNHAAASMHARRRRPCGSLPPCTTPLHVPPSHRLGLPRPRRRALTHARRRSSVVRGKTIWWLRFLKGLLHVVATAAAWSAMCVWYFGLACVNITWDVCEWVL